ncbi:MAG: DUF2970 domain-containing protein [Pseudomonadota bacterium]
MTKQAPNTSTGDSKPLSFLEMLQSTLWAAIGVQKRKNRVRDFSRGNPIHFILMGIGFTAFFVVAMMTLVHTILGAAG